MSIESNRSNLRAPAERNVQLLQIILVRTNVTQFKKLENNVRETKGESDG